MSDTVRDGKTYGRIASARQTRQRERKRPKELRRQDRLLIALRRHLVEHGYEHRVATGSLPHGTHRERGFALWLERDDVVAIAPPFGQSAIFRSDGGAFWLVGALVDVLARQLP